jgi:glycosyltransferase involved in cell wall biosynthesis
MKLIFDCRFIRHDHHDGISRFSSELFRATSKLVPTTALISDLRQLRALPEGVSYILANDPTDFVKELFVARILNKSTPTHVFSPMQTMGSWGRNYKLILTLHDLIYYSHNIAPPALPLLVRVAWRLYHLGYWPARFLLNRADSIVTVSNTSKELIQRRRLTSRPVHVVFNAPDSASLETTDTSSKTVAARKTLVYMGSFMQYKNVECLVEAIEQLEDFELVLLSKISAIRKQELQKRAGSAIERIHFLNGVSDQQYKEVLNGAFALVSASRDEGFGIPIVEAMSHGIPVVISNIPIFKEVAAEAGNYFDPSNANELVSSIRGLDNPDVWSTASEQSYKRAAFFNWDDSARALIRALDDNSGS